MKTEMERENFSPTLNWAVSKVDNDKFKYLTFYRNWIETFNDIFESGNHEQAANLINAAFKLAETGKMPDGVMPENRAILRGWAPAMQKNIRTIERRAAAGAIGGRATGQSKARFGNQNAVRRPAPAPSDSPQP